MDQLKKTPLFATHLALHAKMVDFGGWALPVQYSSILQEHKAVRERAGLFDVSHMGEVFVKGPGALPYLQQVLTNDITGLQEGRCRYSLLCYPDGGSVDDVLVYKFSETKYLVVVNAGNTDKDVEWMQAQAGGFDVIIKNESPQWAQLALQGPLAETILAPLCDMALPEKNYTFVSKIKAAGIPAVISRTGYTGEDGFELYCQAENGERLHAALMEAGMRFELLPCGLGARDTLRFEAGMPLYGHELSAEITPLEAGLSFAVKLGKDDFIGKEALLLPPKRKRIGLQLLDRGIAREHMEVTQDGQVIGITTSGSPAPTLGGNYAMALVQAGADIEKPIGIQVRGRELQAQAVPLPFYKRSKA